MILLTAFQHTSSEWLIENSDQYLKLFLPNDKITDSEKLIGKITNEKIDYIFSFGQRPNIKDKVHIETIAQEGELTINSNFDCDALKSSFEKSGIVAKISHNAGTSFCNKLYFNGLQYIIKNGLDIKMVFIHIPFLKNITDPDCFRMQTFEAIGRCLKSLMSV